VCALCRAQAADSLAVSGCLLELPPPEFAEFTRLAAAGGGLFVLQLKGKQACAPCLNWAVAVNVLAAPGSPMQQPHGAVSVKQEEQQQQQQQQPIQCNSFQQLSMS
jgi:hypothetical protein